MHQYFVDFFRALVRDYPRELSGDQSFLALLELHDVISSDERELLESKVTTTERLRLLYLEILPQKTCRILPRLEKCMKNSGHEGAARKVLKKLEDFLEACDKTVVSFGDEDVPSTSGVRKRGREVAEAEELSDGVAIYEAGKPEKSLDFVVRTFAGELKKFLCGPMFTTIKLMPSHSQDFHIDELWVNLEMKVPDDRSQRWHPVEDYTESFSVSFRNGKPIIVRGEPGIGKSTFLKRLCYDWASGRAFQQFDLLLLCRLREAETADSIFELVLRWAKHALSGELDKVIDRMIAEKSELLGSFKVLIVLDGWDEDIGQCKELQQLLERPRQLSYSLLITTRPMSLQPGDIRFSLYQLTGLKNVQKEEYIDKFFRVGNHESQQGTGSEEERDRISRADKLKIQLKYSEHLKEIARIPLLLSYLCFVDGAETAKNSTELYKIVLQSMIKNFRSKKLKKAKKFTPFNLEDFRWLKDMRITGLGKIAFEGLLAGQDSRFQLIFRESDLAGKVAAEIFEIGFLTRESTTRNEIFANYYDVSFPHKTVQEFFAALYLHSKLKSEENLTEKQRQKIAENQKDWRDFSEAALGETISFLCGLVEEEESQSQSTDQSLFAKFIATNGLTFTVNKVESIRLGPGVPDRAKFSKGNFFRECRSRSTAEVVFRSIFKAPKYPKTIRFVGSSEEFRKFVETVVEWKITFESLTISLNALPLESEQSAQGNSPETDAFFKIQRSLPCGRLDLYMHGATAEEGQKVLKCIIGTGEEGELENVWIRFEEEIEAEQSSGDWIACCPKSKMIVFTLYSDTRLLTPGPDRLSSLAEQHSSLRELEFSVMERKENINVCVEIAAALRRSLRKLSVGVSLDFEKNEWKVEDQIWCLDQLRQMKNLEYLFIERFLLTPDGVEQLLKVRRGLRVSYI